MQLTTPAQIWDLNKLAASIVAKLDEEKQAKIKVTPSKVNRASMIGFPCAWHGWALRARWKDQKPFELSTQYVMDEGKLHERALKADLLRVGFDIADSQFSFELQAQQIVGHIDGRINWNGIKPVYEIKTVGYDPPDKISDLLKSWWMQKYIGQLLTYLYGHDEPMGIFLFKSRTYGRPSPIPLILDDENLERVEVILKRAELINRCIEDGTEPPRREYDTEICGHCKFEHVCEPRKHWLQAVMVNDQIDDAVLIGLIEDWERLKPSHSAYNKAHNKLKVMLKELNGLAIGGQWKVTGKWVERDGYSVEPSKHWQHKIEKI